MTVGDTDRVAVSVGVTDDVGVVVGVTLLLAV